MPSDDQPVTPREMRQRIRAELQKLPAAVDHNGNPIPPTPTEPKDVK